MQRIFLDGRTLNSPEMVPERLHMSVGLDLKECFVGTFISTTPAVWKAPLHFRAL